MDIPRTFSLHVRPDGIASLVFDLPGSPVNLLSVDVLHEFLATLQEISARGDIEKLVLLSGKPSGFVAGANLDEIELVDDARVASAAARLGQRATAAWEALPFPTLSAIDGNCMGGGTELSLAADYIVVSDRPGLRFGLPEVRIGIVPGWGGSVRLPRRVGLEAALTLIVSGSDVDGRRAVELGLADSLLPSAQFRRAVLQTLLELPSSKPPRRQSAPKHRSRWWQHTSVTRSLAFDRIRRRTLAKTGGRYPAPLRAIEVVRIGWENGATAGYEAEVRAIGELATSRVCKNLIGVFRLSERARRQDRLRPTEPVRCLGIVGAGAMGASIAHHAARHANLPVRLLDSNREALEHAMAASEQGFSRAVARKRLTPIEAERRQTLIRPALAMAGLQRCGLLLENVYEDLEVKRTVLAQALEVLPPTAILATNTSSLTVREIGHGLEVEDRLVGLHLFRPVDRMRLVEVIRGPNASDETVATAVDFVHRLGKIPIEVGDSPGFLVNRILYFYLVEALWLLHEGYSVADIDRTMESWGMPVGPFTVLDEIGLDVVAGVSRQLGEAFGRRLPVPPWLDSLVASGLLGRKTGRGFYLYEDRRRTRADPELGKRLDIQQIPDAHQSREPLDRLTLRMVDEAVRCLDEGIVGSADQLDLAMLLGTGFPAFRGGLLRWAGRQGPREVLNTLERVTAGCGQRFRPSNALRQLAQKGTFRR